MKWTLAILPLLAAVVPTFAQDNDTEVPEYVQTVLTALEDAGLTTLASALTLLQGTPDGPAFFEELEDGDKTIFAPSNEAFTSAGFPEDFTEAGDDAELDVDTLTQTLLYHIVDSEVVVDDIAVSPNTTVFDTLLTGADGGNSSFDENQTEPDAAGNTINFPEDVTVPLVLTRESEDAEGFSIFQIDEPIAVEGEATEVGNLQLYVIDQLISLPSSLEDVAETAGLSQLATVLTDLELLEVLNNTSGGLTIFAPNDAAFEAISADLEELSDEDITLILQNHLVTGSVLTSDDITGDDAEEITPSAGPAFEISTNETGTFVTSGDATAEIVQTDVLFNGGVVHVIDAVLVNEDPEVNEELPSPTQTGGSPTGTGGGSETSTPAGEEEEDNAGNFAGKVGVNWGLGGAVVAFGAIVGGGLVGF